MKTRREAMLKLIIDCSKALTVSAEAMLMSDNVDAKGVVLSNAIMLFGAVALARLEGVLPKELTLEMLEHL